MDRIGRQRNAKNRGEAIQIPPLHEALVEVHKEYEKASQASRDMVGVAAEVLYTKYNNKQEGNKRLKEQLIIELEAQRHTASDSELKRKFEQVVQKQ